MYGLAMFLAAVRFPAGMARYEMSLEEKLRGCRKAIRVLERERGGPKWLLPGMRKYARRLSDKLKAGKKK